MKKVSSFACPKCGSATLEYEETDDPSATSVKYSCTSCGDTFEEGVVAKMEVELSVMLPIELVHKVYELLQAYEISLEEWMENSWRTEVKRLERVEKDATRRFLSPQEEEMINEHQSKES